MHLQNRGETKAQRDRWNVRSVGELVEELGPKFVLRFPNFQTSLFSKTPGSPVTSLEVCFLIKERIRQEGSRYLNNVELRARK